MIGKSALCLANCADDLEILKDAAVEHDDETIINNIFKLVYIVVD